jgi:predicted dehydrogenase
MTDDRFAPVRVGMIGVGSHARAVLMPALTLVPGLRLAALATSRAQTAGEAGSRYRVEASPDWRQLVARADLEAVLICAGPDLQATMIEAALTAGKHVFVETPGTNGAEPARRLATLARSRGLVAQVGFCLRHAAAIELLAQRLQRVPPPRLLLCEYFPWVGHQYDLTAHLLGPCTRVLSSSADAAGSHDVLRFASGDTAVVIGRALRNCSVDIERITVSGAGFYGAVEGRRRARFIEDQRDVPLEQWGPATCRGESFEPQPFAGRFEELGGYAPELRAFARAVRGGEAPRATLDDAAAQHELSAAIRAARAGGATARAAIS